MAESGAHSATGASGFVSFPVYTDSGIEWLGEIPAHWAIAALRYRYDQTLGKMLDTKRITRDHLVPYLRNIDVQWDHINTADLPSMDIRPHEIERFTVRSGDLLVCEGGEAGRCAIWRGALDPCGYQKALHRLRPRDRSRDRPQFLCYAFAAAVEREAFADGQGSTISHLTGDMLRAHRFPFPPLSEQQAIADFLDRETAKIDVLVAKQRELIERLHEKRTALIHRAVTKGLDRNAPMMDSGVDWLGLIPASWHLERLKTLTKMKSGESITSGSIEEDGSHPVFGGNGLRGYTSHFTHDGTYVLVGRQGAHCGNVHLVRGRFWASEHAVVVATHRPHLPEWLGAVLEAMDLNQHSVAAAQPGLAVDRVRDLRVPVPAIDEQREIVATLDRQTAEIDALTAKITESINLLDEYRAALISAAVTGQIDVRDHLAATPIPPPTTEETP